MIKTTATQDQQANDRITTDGDAYAASSRGIVHSFVAVGELRRIMICLTATELLQLALAHRAAGGVFRAQHAL